MKNSTALGAKEKTTRTITFKNKEHENFYQEYLPKCRYEDVYHKALVYCLGIDRDTREHINRIYDFKSGCVKTECLHEGWQTSGSVRIVRMAFNLYCDGTPSVLDYEGNPEQELNECREYTVSDLFCCGYARYFWEAIKIRYPEYCFYQEEQWRTQNDRKAGADSQVQNVTATTTETAAATTTETATATTTTTATTTGATTTATTATAATTSAATGGVSIALSTGKKAADKFKAYMQEKAMVTEQAMQDVEQRLNHSQEVNHAMDTMPKVIRYTAATLGAIITAVSAAVVQAVFSFLTAMIAAILTVLIPVIAIIALIATIISILASLTSDTQAGYGLPTFVTEEMMQPLRCIRIISPASGSVHGC